MNKKERLLLTKIFGVILFLIGNGLCLGFALVWTVAPEVRNIDHLFLMVVGLYLMGTGLWMRRTRAYE